MLIETGIIIKHLKAKSISVNSGNLFNENSTNATVIAVIEYAMAIRHKKNRDYLFDISLQYAVYAKN